MITARLNTYSKEEAEAFEMIIDTAHEAFTDVYCNDNVECEQCSYNKLCYDITHLHRFLIRETQCLDHISKTRGVK